MKARYNATDNTLTELSDFSPPPDRPNIKFYSSSQKEMYQRHLEAWHIVMQDYNRGKAEHEKLLRTIPCHESCRSVFKDQGVYEEGKGYELKKWCQDPDMCSISSCDCKEFACPVPARSEDELWRDLINEISNDHMHHDYSGSYIKTEQAIQKLKTKYTITPR